MGLGEHIISTEKAFDLAAASVAYFMWPVPVELIRFVYVLGGASGEDVSTAACVITAALLQADQSAVTPSGAAIETFTIPVTGNENDGYWIDLTASKHRVMPGECLTLTADAAPDTGIGDLSVVVRPLPFVDANHDRAATDPGATDQTTFLGYLTEVTA